MSIFKEETNQDTELFIFSAETVPALIEQIREAWKSVLNSDAEIFVALSAKLAEEINDVHKVRAAVIAGSVEDLVNQLEEAAAKLEEKLDSGDLIEEHRAGLFAGNSVNKSRVGFLFPGQGSQQLNMTRTLVERHDWAREIVEKSAGWLEDAGIFDLPGKVYRNSNAAADNDEIKKWQAELTKTENAQPAICLSAMLWLNYLERLGINSEVVGGHSLGELSAFFAGGAFDAETLMRLVAARAKAMANVKKEGAMCALMCDEKRANELIESIDGYVVVANINSPRQTIISGDISAIDEAVKLAAEEKVRGKKLPVSNAFHSEFVKEAADKLLEIDIFENCVPKNTGSRLPKIISSVNGKEVPHDLDLRLHFSTQVISRVDFISMLKTISDNCDFMIEVGPGRVLTGLVGNISKSVVCLPIESSPSIARDLNTVLASYFVRGGKVNWSELFSNRLSG